ncbi:MAG: hypothetical protein ACOCTK_03435 [Candidatus Saliniplasma sp.]
MSDKVKKPGILKRIASNRDIKIGLICLALALIFAFASISQDVRTSVDEGKLRYAGKDKWYPLQRKLDEIDVELYLQYNSTENTSEAATVYFGEYKDENLTEKFKIPLSAKESREDNNITIDLKEDRDYVDYMWANFSENTTIDFKLTITYVVQPYNLLTFPAMGLTLAGVVFSLKGKSAIMADLGKEKKEEEMIKEMQDKDEEEVSRLRRSRKEQGLQNRPEEERKDIKFMGIDFKDQKEEEEE